MGMCNDKAPHIQQRLDARLHPARARKAASAPLPLPRGALSRWFDDPLRRPNQYSTIRDAIEGQARAFGNKTFLIYEETGQEYSYRYLDRETSRSVNLLCSLGIAPGARIGILDANTPDFVFLYMGCMKGGYTAAPLNYHLKAPELLYCLENSEAQALFVSHEFWPEIAKIHGQLGFLRAIVLMGHAPKGVHLCRSRKEFANADRGREHGSPPLIDYEALRAATPHRIPTTHKRPRSDTPAEIIYTSGTTGKAKGVLLRHHQFLTDAKYISRWFRMTPDTRMMMILPMFHVNAEVVTIMTPLVAGGSVVMFRKFSATRFWPAIDHWRVNIFSTVPTILSILIAKELEATQDPRAKSGKPAGQMWLRKQGCAASHNLSSLQAVICGAAPLPAEVQLEWERVFLVPIIEGYGLSETTCYSTFNPVEGSRKIATIGVEVGNEIALVDGHSREMRDDTMGEIVIRGENVMREYFKRPEANLEAFAGGWFHSGDVGERDCDGFIRIRDRIKDMIIRGGENIYPREIDELLYTHPQIENAATIGIPHPKYGEEVASFVVLRNVQVPTGAEARRLESEMLAWCRERLADFKAPKSITFVSEIPKGPTGKLLRRVLRDMVSAAQ